MSKYANHAYGIKLGYWCRMCGAEPGQPCTIISGDEGEKPGDVRESPHQGRNATSKPAVLIPDEPAP